MTECIIRENFIVKRDKETGKVCFDINFKKLSGHKLTIQEYKKYLEDNLRYTDWNSDPLFTVTIQPKDIVRVTVNSRDCHFNQMDSGRDVYITALENPSKRIFTLYLREYDNRVHMDIDISVKKLIL